MSRKYQLEVRQDADGAWRVFAAGVEQPLKKGLLVLGGRIDQAIEDAVRLAKTDGDLFEYTPPGAGGILL